MRSSMNLDDQTNEKIEKLIFQENVPAVRKTMALLEFLMRGQESTTMVTHRLKMLGSVAHAVDAILSPYTSLGIDVGIAEDSGFDTQCEVFISLTPGAHLRVLQKILAASLPSLDQKIETILTNVATTQAKKASQLLIALTEGEDKNATVIQRMKMKTHQLEMLENCFAAFPEIKIGVAHTLKSTTGITEASGECDVHLEIPPRAYLSLLFATKTEKHQPNLPEKKNESSANASAKSPRRTI